MFVAATIFLALFSIALSDKCSNVTCPKVPKHYEELGCKPIIPAGQCCPQSFDCSEYESRDPSICYHNEKTYEVEKEIDDPELESSCVVGCRCQRDDEEPAKIVCGHIDCPEFFGWDEDQPKSKNCIAQYKQNGCCKERDVCDNELKSLAKCTFEGKTYYEGQQMEPTDSCYTCWCGKGYEDKPVHSNKHCHKINCNIDLHYSDRLHTGCVPIYYRTEDCCPIGTRCPDDTTTVIKSKNSPTAPDSPECTFGYLKLAIGDVLSPENEDNCKVCTCKIPPFVTCVQTC